MVRYDYVRKSNGTVRMRLATNSVSQVSDKLAKSEQINEDYFADNGYEDKEEYPSKKLKDSPSAFSIVLFNFIHLLSARA